MTETRLNGIVTKGWGSEKIWVTNDKYCSKFLNFNKDAQFSMHFHANKEETWYVMSGRFFVYLIDTKTGSQTIRDLVIGDVLHIKPLTPHRLRCLEAGTILEVSTPDSIEDNYRVSPGDSQK